MRLPANILEFKLMADDDDKVYLPALVPMQAPEVEVLEPEVVPEPEVPEWQQHDEAASLAEAREAWARIKFTTRHRWADWEKIGLVLRSGREAALYASGAKGPRGKRYTATFSEWLERYGFADIKETTRAFLLKIMDDWSSVSAWRDELSEDDRLKWNHPATVWQHFKSWKRRQGSTPRKTTTSLKTEHAKALEEIAQLKAAREDDAPLVSKHDSPSAIARAVWEWLPAHKHGRFIAAFNQLVEDGPRPSPRPKPQKALPPRIRRQILD